MKEFKKILTLIYLSSLILVLNSCNIYRPVDASKFPPEPDKRVQKNIEEGRGFRLFDPNKKNSGTFDFASSNELWRASLEVIDFMPLVSANYSGGIIITDWYTDNSTTNEAIKITIRFLSNEIGVGSLDVKIFKKICDSLNSCRTVEEKGSLVAEVKKSILKRAAIYEKEKKDKNFKKYKMSTPGKSD